MAAANPARSRGAGLCFGIGAFGAGVWWIYESFKFSNMGPVIAAPLTLGFVAFLALYPALAGWVVAKLRMRDSGGRGRSCWRRRFGW